VAFIADIVWFVSVAFEFFKQWVKISVLVRVICFVVAETL
jgi:hypothetical protein